jgi:SPP1 gp7 family putative phage head morphogenesis protein
MCSGLTVLTRDPTRTLTLRNKFVSDMQKRMRELKGLINKTLIQNNALGFGTGVLVLVEAGGPGQFAYSTDDAKLAAFMQWWRGVEDEILLGISASIEDLTQTVSHWTDDYIERAYRQGVVRAQAELEKAGVTPRFEQSSLLGVEAAMVLPVHMNRARLAYTRTFNELKGVTDAMDQQISRILAEGLATGQGPRQIAREMNAMIDKMTRTRANLIARTEIVRAHHMANIEEYRAAGIEGVVVKAEWVTAGDGAVCPLCEPLQGKVFKIDEIAGMIPRHPNCRCVAIPITPNLDKKKYDGPDLTQSEAIALGEANLNEEKAS